MNRNRRARLLSGIAATTCLTLLIQASPNAIADQRLDALRRESANLKTVISQSDQDLEGLSKELVSANERLKRSRSDLADAQATLAAAEVARDAADQEDQRLAGELERAQQALVGARQAVADGRADLEREQQLIGQAARRTQQQAGPLHGLAAFTTAVGTGDLQQKAQWTKQIFNATQNQMDRLEAAQIKLEQAEQDQMAVEAKTRGLREEAANNLEVKKNAEAEAVQAEQDVNRLVAENEKASKIAADEVAAEEKRNEELEAERAAVDKRIQARIAEIRAEEKRREEARQREIARQKELARKRAQALAEQAARERAAAKKAAEAAAKAKEAERAEAERKAQAAERKASATERQLSQARRDESSASRRSDASGSSGLSMPVNGPVTSTFGTRLHPILRVWKLHDGVDFGASCGTPLRAAADGVVTDRYYNGGYGNRLMIDHGMVGGRYITTSYNHATNYVVSPGQRVTKGQTVGYVGSTGYSTGCHLHFMAWVDGKLVNPLTVLP